MNDEFDLINRYFKKETSLHGSDEIVTGIGDDCALIKPKDHKLLAISTDTLIEGVHFPKNTCAADIAIKSLAVNLSDLAAMGAKPAWYTLALTLPTSFSPEQINAWLKEFSLSLHQSSQQYQIDLIGGDSTQAETLSITIQVHGYIENQAMRRSQAKAGDVIVISDKLGAAALGLKLALNNSSIDINFFTSKEKQQALDALNKPLAEIKKGLLISKYSQCAIDISDGFMADLNHILEQSQCNAKIYIDQIPLASCLQNLDKEKALIMALTGGDDYKLCVTLPEKLWQQYQKDTEGVENTHFYPIGEIISSDDFDSKANLNNRIHLIDQENNLITELDHINLSQLSKGFNHFA